MYLDFERGHHLSIALPWIEPWLTPLVAGIDLVAIVILAVGALRFLYWIVRGELFSASGEQRLARQNLARLELGRYILSALELLIVADVIRTALSFRLDGILFLAGLVLVRSVISWFLDREIAAIEHRRSHDPPE
jgi:uncharacterized membrane protein